MKVKFCIDINGILVEIYTNDKEILNKKIQKCFDELKKVLGNK